MQDLNASLSELTLIARWPPWADIAAEYRHCSTRCGACGVSRQERVELTQSAKVVWAKLSADERPEGRPGDQYEAKQAVQQRACRPVSESPGSRCTGRSACRPSAVDVTLAGRGQAVGQSASGYTHPSNASSRIFRGAAGFRYRAEGPEIEDDFHNFHRTECPAGSSGARDARHVLSRRRTGCCAPIRRRCRFAPCRRRGRRSGSLRRVVSIAAIPI